MIYHPEYLPRMFIEGSGLTLTKVLSEYIIIGLFVASFILYWRRFEKTGEKFIIFILAAIILCIFSELSFTLYLSAFDTYNMLGHIYKIIAFIMIYIGIFIVTILQPYHDLELEIAERKKAEDEIRMFMNVVESSDDAIITKSLDGTVTSWNKGAEEMYGYSAEEIIGKNISILSPPKLKKEIPDLIDKVEHGEKIQRYETLRLKKDGTLINASITLSPVFDISGKMVKISIIARDITDTKKAEDEIKRALKEKEVLLREIHHRVNNNMQIILSLLNLQTQYVETDEALEILQETQNRVKAMATIHENLYQSHDLTTINFAEYIQSLVKGIFFSYRIKEGQIEPIIEIGDVMLNIETAVPCGLIISELVSNSLKHAFSPEQKGIIRISLHSQDDTFTLTINDNGIGFPDDLDFKNTNSLGLQLVNNLINQIDGDIQLNKTHGTEFIITFKELKYTERI
ncbi:MASE3 domain-containing protein [Methanobacterium ferruginis]|uniref:MASE3 domain-containing protein n=1 Tax=Methanobacterium ferruginis TaxID=710191 RepID=UPI0025737C90|nr:MASE3 domain-containing protein [Methanobacterium ferruginis]